MADADSKAEDWHKVWLVDEPYPEFQWPQVSSAEVEALPWPTYDQFVAFCRTFQASRTGVGCCQFHPRHFALLSPEGFEVFLLLWKAMLTRAEAPQELEDLIICLIQKRADGTRPIALVSSCIRVLNRWLRRSYGETWRQANTRTYVHGSKEASVAFMPWKLAAAAECPSHKSEHCQCHG